MLSKNLGCLYTSVRNVSGIAMIFGFLPPHGVQLASGEEYTMFGSPVEAISRANPGAERRNFTAFAAAIARGDMVIVSTPNPILVDAASGSSKMVILNSTLTVSDPCWDTDVNSLSSLGVPSEDAAVPESFIPA